LKIETNYIASNLFLIKGLERAEVSKVKEVDVTLAQKIKKGTAVLKILPTRLLSNYR
jgi:multidrug efflux pump subunit AcrA (membrane-fusion protein)